MTDDLYALYLVVCISVFLTFGCILLGAITFDIVRRIYKGWKNNE